MVHWVVDAARVAGASPIVLVIGYGAEALRASFEGQDDVLFAVQEQQLGTGDAVRAGLEALPSGCDSVFVLCGDVPLIPSDDLAALAAAQNGRDVAVLSFIEEPPHGYGRMLRSGDVLRGIIEAKDADDEQLQIAECNSGTYCFNETFLRQRISGLNTDNAQGEFYLTDLVAMAQDGAGAVAVVTEESGRLAGANDRRDLATLQR